MNKNKKNRREFLEIAGLSVAGVVIASTGINATAETSIAAHQMPFEDWLLSTGKDKLPVGLNTLLPSQDEKSKG